MKKLFYNADIITMEEENNTFNSMLIEDNRICGIGKYEDLKGAGSEEINLEGRTVMPGFFDAHGHFFITAAARSLFVDLSCAPSGTIKSVDDVIKKLKEYEKEHPGEEPIVGFGFDDTLMDDFKMPSAKDLDSVSKNRWVIVLHVSMHMLSANSKAMEDAGITDDSFNPSGGKVYFENGKATGVFEEMPAMGKFMEAAFSKDIMKRLGEGIEKTTSEYINKGVTVICEGAGGNNMAWDIERMIEKGIFKNRYIICPSYTGTVPPLYSAKDRLKIINGPVKLIMDGSIQNYTAYMREDYYKAHPTRENKDSPAGFPHMTLEELTKRIGEICCSGRTFAVHANGDKALDMVIKATEECFKRGQINDGPNLVIHCQNADKKQLEKMKALSLYPSFFPVHIYIYGDRHYEMFLGPKRSERINPINDAVKIGNIFSIHSDSPVAPCNPLELVWCAVKRQTASGRILGEEQRISVYEAFKGVTINAALSYGVGDELGSLCEGKRADFVVLDKNPLKTEIDEIPKIKVENVYIDGEKIK